MESDFKVDMAKRSAYVDNMKFDFKGTKFLKAQPFWIHYMWTGGAKAGQ